MKAFLTSILVLSAFWTSAQAPITAETRGFLSFNEGKVLSLAEKFSEAQYDWAPAEDVRSVGEVLLHVAAANYFFLVSSGYALPEGIDPMTMESSIEGKEDILKALKSSYAYLQETISSIPEDALGDKVNFPFEGEFTKQSMLLIAIDHTSEHLGQLIAYARMNAITPPWSESTE